MPLRKSRHNSAFSLVELLVAIGVIAILGVLSLPALSGLVSAGNVNSTVSDVSQLLNQARAYAMGHDTYVWVGFYQENTPSTRQLMVGAVAGSTGQSTDINSATTLTVVAKTQAYSRMKLTSVQSLPNLAALHLTDSTEVTDLAPTTASPTFAIPNFKPATTFTQIVQYYPDGRTCVLPAGTSDGKHQLQIGLQPLTGNQANVAAIEISTLTGQVRTLRP